MAACLSVWACAGSASQTGGPTPVPVQDDHLGRGDVFEVRVFPEEELGGKFQVSAEGSIDFPLIGSVRVLGDSPSEVAEEISRRLRAGHFLLDPHVSVFVLESNSKRITVIGAVAKPSNLELTPGLSVVQAISLAGGFSALADRNRTVVTRREDGKLRRYTVPVAEITSGNHDDFFLKPGDIVFVPERVF